MTIGYYKNYLYTTDISAALKKKGKKSQYMVSHPETGSDSPIGSDRDRGRDTPESAVLYMMGREYQQGLWLKQVEEEMEEKYLALDSSPSRPQEHEHLSSGSPLPLRPVRPPGPAAGGEKRSASP